MTTQVYFYYKTLPPRHDHSDIVTPKGTTNFNKLVTSQEMTEPKGVQDTSLLTCAQSQQKQNHPF